MNASNLAVRVEGIGKRYRSDRTPGSYGTLRDALSSAARLPLARLTDKAAAHSEFWALRDVSFEVQQGEVLGIIGRNGAGKSTLLKLLSRITEPTTGRVELRGRTGSLLEVGTGFHPELSGRENIYLNGAILGMSRRDISAAFDSIVDFAGTRDFLDLPVKRYSSGMQTRLAFSVAAHLAVDILIIDEVLAVGDFEFQRRCIQQMNDVARQGRTVLFVSHDVGAVATLCDRTLWLAAGSCIALGPTDRIIHRYLSATTSAEIRLPTGVLYSSEPANEQSFFVTRIELYDAVSLTPISSATNTTELLFRVSWFSPYAVHHGGVVLHISSSEGVPLLVAATEDINTQTRTTFPYGNAYIDCRLSPLPLTPGTYLVGVSLDIPGSEWLFRGETLGMFNIEPARPDGLPETTSNSQGIIASRHSWTLPMPAPR